jgi:hypothetical protein
MDKNTNVSVDGEGRGERPAPSRGETVGQRGARRGGIMARIGRQIIRRVPYKLETLIPGKDGLPDRVKIRYRTDERYMNPAELVARSTYNRRKRQTHRRRRW